MIGLYRGARLPVCFCLYKTKTRFLFNVTRIIIRNVWEIRIFPSTSLSGYYYTFNTRLKQWSFLNESQIIVRVSFWVTHRVNTSIHQRSWPTPHELTNWLCHCQPAIIMEVCYIVVLSSFHIFVIANRPQTWSRYSIKLRDVSCYQNLHPLDESRSHDIVL